MRVLIAGRPNTGQKDVLRLLTKVEADPPFQGLVLDHTFETKYFNASCPIWVDEFESSQAWVNDFTSDEAQEVREALTLFIYTYDSQDPQFEEVGKFARKLDAPGKCIALAKHDKIPAEAEDCEDFDCIDYKELEPLVHMAIYDALNDKDNDELEGEDEDEFKEAHMDLDLDAVVSELKNARNSTSMTEEQKKALVDRIVTQLDI